MTIAKTSQTPRIRLHTFATACAHCATSLTPGELAHPLEETNHVCTSFRLRSQSNQTTCQSRDTLQNEAASVQIKVQGLIDVYATHA
jgi:hypothetical protein